MSAVYDMSSSEEDVSVPEEDSQITIKPVSEEETNISKSVTVILKAITHRGTQTQIHCDPNLTKEDFINMIIKMKI